MNYFNLKDDATYQRWVESKLSAYQKRTSADFKLLVDIDSDGHIPAESLSIIKEQINDYNFALYKMSESAEDHLSAVKNIGNQVGLKELDKNLCAQEDRITKLTVVDHQRGHSYIPYSNKAIGWHTDGYYNPLHQRVLALVLHCEHSSEQGGVNELLDPDMVYIHLRDQNPEFIEALSNPGVMCIPENIEDGVEIRPQTCTAVFMPEHVAEHDPVLAMRFSKRKHNIIWADDVLTQDALTCLFEYLESDSLYHVKYRLNSGEGVICNNVLHTRSAFTDSAENKRVYYRARYYNRIKI